MRKLHLLLPAVVSALAPNAHGFIFHEPFDYPVGDLTQGAVTAGTVTTPYVGSVNPWGPQWTQTGSGAAADNVAVISPGLAGPQSWLAGTGNTAYIANAGNGSRIGIGPFITPATGSETVYYSLSLKITDASALGGPTVATGTTMVAFNNLQDAQTNVPGVIAARLVARRHETDTTKYQLGINKKQDGTTVWETDGVGGNLYRDVGTEYFVVGGYTLQGGTDSAAADDEVRLWIDPDVATYGTTEAGRPAPTLFSSNSTDIYSSAAGVNQVRIESMVIQQRGATSPALTAPNGIQLDEIRVGTRWADVAPGAPRVWSGASGGNWNDGPNWGGTEPGIPTDIATFPTAVGPITVNLDVSSTVGTLNFNSAQPYTINPIGGAVLTLDGSPTIHVSDGTAHAVNAPVSVADDITVTVATAKAVALDDVTFAAGARLTKAGAGTLTVNRVRTDEVRMFGGTLRLAPDSGADGVSVIDTLEMRNWTPAAANPIPDYTYNYNNPSKIDVTNNKLIIHNASAGTATGGTYDGVQGLVQRASNAGAWDGTGITTSESDALSGLTSIGVGTGAQVLALAAGATDTFAGQTVTDTSVLVMYTYRGDANMDGFISGDDYSAIDFASGTPGASGWINGDFNYDGIISGDDYSAIDFNLVAQGAPFFAGGTGGAGGISAVPEPASALGAALLAAGLLGRRRRRRLRGSLLP